MEKRINEIDAELRTLQEETATAEAERLEEIEKRVTELAAEKEGITADIEQRRQEQEALEKVKESEAGLKVIEQRGDTNKMEIRESKEYLNAYVDYIKTGDATECRALLTENAGEDGTVPVPAYVESRIETAWERLQLLGRVRRSEFKGNVKVGVELTATPAEIHEEGGEAIAEEELALAIVNIVPETIKKWISFSDEAVDLGGEAFVDYIYDEITYQIAKKAEDEIIGTLMDQDEDNNGGNPAVAVHEVSEIGLADFVNAAGLLAGDIANPVIITSRAVYAAYKAAAMAANYAVDPFDGMEVIFADGFDYDDPTKPVAFVGDPAAIQVNMPNGADPQLKYDEYTLATSDLVRVIGRLPVGIGYIKNYGFAKIAIDDDSK